MAIHVFLEEITKPVHELPLQVSCSLTSLSPHHLSGLFKSNAT